MKNQETGPRAEAVRQRKAKALSVLAALGFVDNDDDESPGMIWHRETGTRLDTEQVDLSSVVQALIEIGRQAGRSELRADIRALLGV